MPIAEIEPADVLAAVCRIESKGKLESAKRTLQLAGCVFRYAVATARLGSDPTRDLRGVLTAPSVTHYGAVLGPVRVGELLRATDGYEGQPVTKLAMQLAPHVFVRPGELHGPKSTSTPRCGPSRRARPKCARTTSFRSHVRP